MGERRDRKHRFDGLRRIPLLAGCTAAELAEVDGLGTQTDVRAATRLTTQGGPAEECFVVVGGSAVVRCGELLVGSIDAGSVAGEMGLLHGHARNATVVAATPMRLLVLDRRELASLIRAVPSIEVALEELAAARQAELELVGAA
ncbi:MAG TPA: cyclic nucleotide-binding domain-containing protein [Acidimicrobiales bacterium]|nr:cyclic nucleotide-binding domain-containing protein [Acidimicrobiales bacterium]